MAAQKRGGLWGWVQDVGKTCGFAQQPQPPPMWVRANPDLFPQEVPGMNDELLAQVSQLGGSLEEKIQSVVDAFRSNARHLESLQQVLRRRALERREKAGEDQLPAEVEEVISEGSYLETFLEAFDGQSFPLFTEEVVPCHSYRLALEVHSGGAYWSSIPTQDAGVTRHKVETVSASSAMEGSASIISQFGAAQRGAVFVWRWQHLLDQGPYNIPDWLSRALSSEGNDPLRKLMGELEAIRRWEQQVKLETAKHVKQGSEVKDPYIREVLRLWPSEPDPQGGEQLKKCAWVEGLDPRLFVGRRVLVRRMAYDANHALTLHASIAKRHSEEAAASETNPPYRLTTTWDWAPAPSSSSSAAAAGRPASSSSLAGGAGAGGGSAAGSASVLGGARAQEPFASRADSMASIGSSRIADNVLSRPGTATSLSPSELTRPGSTYSDVTRPGTYPDLARLPTSEVRTPAASPSAPPAVAYNAAYGGYGGNYGGYGSGSGGCGAVSYAGGGYATAGGAGQPLPQAPPPLPAPPPRR